jgi:hypothetical protein
VNQKGNLLLLILLGFLFVALIVPIVMKIFWPADIIFRIILIFFIFSIVRGFLGSGVLTLIISGILIYLMVFKWGYIFASLYVMYLLLGIGALSVIVWGIGIGARRH